jgi:hypothetical protein
MYLSYSGYQLADDCQYRYWHAYIAKTPGEPEDILGSIYGSAVGLLFEEFYNQRLWTLPDVRSHMEAQAERVVDHFLLEGQQPKRGRPAGIVRWKGLGEADNPQALYASRDDIVSDVRAAVLRGLQTIREHRLLGRGAKAEVKLDARVQGHTLGGRADFVLTRVRPYDDLVILDGKGSRKRDRYVSRTQLIWYSMLYAEHHKRVPDKAAFVYWHFDPPSNIDWCKVTEPETTALKKRVLGVIETLSRLDRELGATADLASVRSSFLPRASNSSCRFCPYATESVCPQGFAIVTELKRKKFEGPQWRQ